MDVILELKVLDVGLVVLMLENQLLSVLTSAKPKY
jgi:hypothetical protein